MVLHPTITLEAKLAKLSNNHEENRNNPRSIIINSFMKEKAGHGKAEETSKYKYIVETLRSGSRIYLTRPATLSKGFDFIIHAEDYVFINGRDNPKHDDILSDLKKKKQNNAKTFTTLFKALEAVFNCNDADDIFKKYEKDFASFTDGLPTELILKTIKWLFIEQDVRYWNWSGRHMLMGGIRTI